MNSNKLNKLKQIARYIAHFMVYSICFFIHISKWLFFTTELPEGVKKVLKFNELKSLGYFVQVH